MTNDNVELKQEVNPTDNLLNELAEMKRKMDEMIPVDKYSELEKQNKKLLNDFVNARPAPKQEIYKKEDLDTSARQLVELGKKGVTNREYIEASLRHRNISLEITGKDPYGQNGQKSPESIRSADFFQWALDNSNSPSQFRMLMDQGVMDDPTVIAKVNQYRAQVKTADRNKK